MAPTKLTEKDQIKQFLDSHDTFLFDCDGVLWRGSTVLPNAPEMLQMLRDLNKQLIFVTNNSTKSRRQYAEKFTELGIPVKDSEIFCSSYSAAMYLKKVVNFPADKKVLIVGEKGLEEELELAGIKHVGGTDPALNDMSSVDTLDSIECDESIGCVLAGLDRFINYRKLGYAQAQLIKRPHVMFMATNIDSTFPTHGRFLPGAGTIVEAVATASGRRPEAVAGKPNKAMMDSIKATVNFDPKKTVMIGDRLNTDMEFGLQGGLTTLMVLTGVDTEETILDENASTVPHFYADQIGDLFTKTR